MDPVSWLDKANCKDMDEAEWEEIKLKCADCTVVRECLMRALKFQPEYGVWGGLWASELKNASKVRRVLYET